MRTSIRIATRKSPLALWQSEHVAARLRQAHPGLSVELVPMSTRGDEVLDRSLAAIGGKGLFLKELELAMLRGEADCAVHSLKDVPMELDAPFALPAILTRADPADAFVSNHYDGIASLPHGARVGTSSLRRQAQLRALRPEARFLELVHRLDRDTSGVLLVAKKRSALRSLHEQLREKGMQKDYLALVRGQWQSHVKVVQAPLLKNILQSGERIVRVSQEGKPSETRFKVEERYEFATLMRCSPVTGRTHQIRVHTQYAGHPIAFDDRYGDREFDKQLAGTGLSRLFLHAAALKFTHPNTGEVIRIEAPLDEQLKRCLKVLRG